MKHKKKEKIVIPQLVSVSEASEFLKITRQAVIGRILRNSLPGRMVGSQYVIPGHAIRREVLQLA